MRALLLTLAVLELCCDIACAGEIHKWTDAEGNVHYGDIAPRDQSSTAINPVDSTSSDGPSRSAQDRMENQYRVIQELSEDRIRRQEEKEKAEKKEKKRQGACAMLKDRAVTLRDGGRLYDIKPDGSREYLSDDIRRKRTEETDTQLKKYCR